MGDKPEAMLWMARGEEYLPSEERLVWLRNCAPRYERLQMWDEIEQCVYSTFQIMEQKPYSKYLIEGNLDLARAACAKGEQKAAQAYLNQARQYLSEKAAEKPLLARQAEVQGYIAEAAQQWLEAVHFFRKSALDYFEIGAYRTSAELICHASEIARNTLMENVDPMREIADKLGKKLPSPSYELIQCLAAI
jgi:hypothetical protein